MRKKWLKTQDSNCTFIASPPTPPWHLRSNGDTKSELFPWYSSWTSSLQVWFLYYQVGRCQSPLNRPVVLLWRNKEATVVKLYRGGWCCTGMLQTSGTWGGLQDGQTQWRCRAPTCHVTHSQKDQSHFLIFFILYVGRIKFWPCVGSVYSNSADFSLVHHHFLFKGCLIAWLILPKNWPIIQ